MKQNSESIYKFIARVDAIRKELNDLRNNIEHFILLEDYVLPKKCLEQLRDIQDYYLDDTEAEVTALETELTHTMVLCEEEKDEHSDEND